MPFASSVDCGPSAVADLSSEIPEISLLRISLGDLSDM